MTIKKVILGAAKWSGVFRLSRYLLRHRLLILCYHGFQVADEAAFRPKLFMRGEILSQRLEMLRRQGFTVLPLGEALRRLADGSLPKNSVCITIDDGFYSTLSIAAPIFERYRMPATLYLTSYYSRKAAPVFRLVVQYMFWKCRAKSVDFSDQSWGATADLSDPSERERLCWSVIGYGEKQCDEAGRRQICTVLGERLGVDYAAIEKSKMLSLLDAEDLNELMNRGIDVQLHTHRHHFPKSEQECRAEIRENREYLKAVLNTEQTHFCYPSGAWSPEQWPWLAEEGVVSATTCEYGFNTRATPLLGLYRMLDEDDLSALEFEAGICGFRELVYMVTGMRRRSHKLRRVGESMLASY